MNTQNKQNGFTIIEVVLVLAIAALIFLMIFIALPALQRGQRDTARKNDANTVVSALNAWTSNHRGTLPSTDNTQDADFATNYVKKLNQYDATTGDNGGIVFKGSEYKSTDATSGGDGEDAAEGSPTIDQIVVAIGAKCDDTGSNAEKGSNRSAAVLIRLEASNAVICSDA